MKRKICSLFLALVLCACMAVPASAMCCRVPVRFVYRIVTQVSRFRNDCGCDSTPAMPVVPATPAEPVKPTEPVSAEPVKPAEPEPAQPVKPAEPEPAQPVKSAEPVPTEQDVPLDYEHQVLALVNQERAAYGLSALEFSDTLADGARLKSKDLHDNRYFDHNSPTYGTPFEMMRSLGITYSYAGENIAMGYATPEAVVRAWMNSPGHRANILNANYTALGVGYVKDGGYWTQWFRG